MNHTVAPHAPMDLNHLTLFARVCDLGSFARAAEALGLRRSSVSRTIAALESQLGVQLFSRTTRHVAPTTAGAALYAKIAPQLAALREAVGSLPEAEQQPSGLLRITAPNDIGAVLLPSVLAGFSKRYPGVEVDVRLTSRQVDLVAEGFDVALRVSMGQLADSSLISRRLTAMEMQMFATPGYLAEAPPLTVPADLLKHRLIMLYGMKLPPTFALPSGAPQMVSDDVLFVHGAVKAGLGIGILPTFLTQQDVGMGQLVRLLPKISITSGILHFVHPPAQHVPRKVTSFREHLATYLKSRPMGQMLHADA